MILTKQQLEALPIVDKIIASGEAQKGGPALPWLDSNDIECRQTGRSMVFAVALVRAAAADTGRQFRILDHYQGDMIPRLLDRQEVLKKVERIAALDPRLGPVCTMYGETVAFTRRYGCPIENWLPPVMSGEVEPQLGLTAEQVAAMRPKEKPLTVPNIVTYVECEVDCVRYYPRDSTGRRIAREVTLTIDCAGDDDTLAELDACIEFGKVLMCKHRQRKPKEPEGQG